jgi:Tfp pilus assembly protein PilV
MARNLENKFPNFFLLGLKFYIFGRMETKNPKSGFGLIEVMLAAVVLAFMLVGLAYFQLGNRESVLRIRTRDAANFVAQHVLDSLGATGIEGIVANGEGIVMDQDHYKYNFESKQTGVTQTEFHVVVKLIDVAEAVKTADDATLFSKAYSDPSSNTKYVYQKSLNAVVSWQFKNSTQSIQIAKVVR